MTKHRDVNKCRQQEKYKMADLIRQANKRVRNGQQAKDKKKKERMVKKKGEKREKKTPQQHFLKRKRRQVMSASNGTKAGYT